MKEAGDKTVSNEQKQGKGLRGGQVGIRLQAVCFNSGFLSALKMHTSLDPSFKRGRSRIVRLIHEIQKSLKNKKAVKLWGVPAAKHTLR